MAQPSSSSPPSSSAPSSAWSKRETAGLVLAPVLAVASHVMVGGDAGVACGLFVLAGTLWLTEALHPAATALVVVALAPVVGACTVKEAFAALGNPILFLFVGSFMLAEAMRLHGLGERLAGALARRAHRRFTALALSSLSAFVLSMWVSNAAATAIVLPIALALGRGDGDDLRRFRAALVLGVAWAASMGGLCTPVGTPPNLIGLRALDAAGTPVSFAGWMAVGTPIGLVMWAAMLGVLAWRFGVRPGQPLPPHTTTAATSWTRGEIASLSAFALAVALWIGPGALELCGVEGVQPWKARLSEEVVAVLAAAVLFVWPVNARGEAPRRALSWDEASRIDWGTVLLFGGGILLGDLANKSGLAKLWGEALLSASGASSTTAVVMLVSGVALVLSEVASNTAAATLVIPLATGLATAAHVSPVLAVVGATLGASFGFMMPVSTAPNAMAYGTGQVSMREMVATGVVFDVFGYVVVVAGVLLLCR
jgi:sodium-dependent dicarboxylate transporter 2/3/5